MIGYHWSPHHNHTSILKRGLLQPKLHPRLVTPVVCSEGHRNPHLSASRHPRDAWELSGGFLVRRAKEQGTLNDGWHNFTLWDLYQIDLRNIKYRTNFDELQVRVDIPRRYVTWIGERWSQL